MKPPRIVSVLACVLLSATLVTACSGGEESSGGTPDDKSSSSGEKKKPNKLLNVSYDPPKGFTEDPELSPLVEFGKKYEASFYQQDGAKTDEIVFVANYLLDEEIGDSRDDWEAAVTKFDKKMKNKDSGISNIALVNGQEGVFRRAEFAHPEKKKTTVHVDNTFIFDGRRMIQVGCQWDKDYKASEKGCVDVLNSLSFKG